MFGQMFCAWAPSGSPPTTRTCPTCLTRAEAAVSASNVRALATGAALGDVGRQFAGRAGQHLRLRPPLPRQGPPHGVTPRVRPSFDQRKVDARTRGEARDHPAHGEPVERQGGHGPTLTRLAGRLRSGALAGRNSPAMTALWMSAGDAPRPIGVEDLGRIERHADRVGGELRRCTHPLRSISPSRRNCRPATRRGYGRGRHSRATWSGRDRGRPGARCRACASGRSCRAGRPARRTRRRCGGVRCG